MKPIKLVLIAIVPQHEGAMLETRLAERKDVPLVLDFVRAIAAFEQLADQVVATPEELEGALFGPGGNAAALLAFWEGQPAGFAIFYYNFSSFLGRKGMFLEDVYVHESHRGRGIGRALLVELAQLAVKDGCGRFEWMVLNWNQRAIDFYDSIGAKPLSEWTIYRMDRATIERLARGWGAGGELRRV